MARYDEPKVASNGILVYAGVPRSGIGGVRVRLASGLQFRVRVLHSALGLHSACFNASVCVIIGYGLQRASCQRPHEKLLCGVDRRC